MSTYVPPPNRPSSRWPKEGADETFPEAAQQAMDEGKFDEAKEHYFVSLTNSSDPQVAGHANYILARCIVERQFDGSPRQIADYIEKAANLGHAQAQYEYGLMFENGENGIEKNDEMAFSWFNMAANRGHIIAASAAADKFNVLFPNDPTKEAECLYKKAIELYDNKVAQGDVTQEEQTTVAHAAIELAKIINEEIKNVKESKEAGNNDNGNSIKVLELFKRAATQGGTEQQYTDALSELNKCYQEKYSIEEVCEWYTDIVDMVQKNTGGDRWVADIAYIVGIQHQKVNEIAQVIPLLENTVACPDALYRADALFRLSEIYADPNKNDATNETILSFTREGFENPSEIDSIRLRIKNLEGNVSTIEPLIQQRKSQGEDTVESEGLLSDYKKELAQQRILLAAQEQNKQSEKSEQEKKSIESFCKYKSSAYLREAAIAGHIEANLKSARDKANQAKILVDNREFQKAFNLLGQAMYNYMKIAKQDPEMANKLWLKDNIGKGDDQYKIGYWLLFNSNCTETNKISEGLKYLQQAATAGYAPAYLVLGKIYEAGKIVSKNNTLAGVYYQKAVDLGDSEEFKKALEENAIRDQLYEDQGRLLPSQFFPVEIDRLA